MPTKGGTSQTTSDRPQHHHHSKTHHHQQQKPSSTALPYVLNPTQDSNNPDSSGLTAGDQQPAPAPLATFGKGSMNSSRASSVASGDMETCEKNSGAVSGSGEDKDSGNGVTSTQELSSGNRRNTRSKNTDRYRVLCLFHFSRVFLLLSIILKFFFKCE